MARKALKALKDTTKALGGLGAAYFLSEALGPTVKPQDVDPVSAARDPETIKVMQDAERKRQEEAERARLRTAPAINLNKEGGAVKGWGKARGARAAKVY